ncbi:MAG: 30S ribosomal protein S13 [Candidatus Micrarchaeia archaeon]
MADQQHVHKDEKEKRATSIVRIAGKDIDGKLGVERALQSVKGLGHNMSHALAGVIESKLSIPKDTPIGSLEEDKIGMIEKAIKDPVQYGIPKYMLNRRKDFESGKDMHVVGSELIFAMRQDVGRDVSMRTWRGFRHQYGQKVRGQHTRSTGRQGATVGVMKKTVAAAQKAAASGGKGGSSESKK